jgi:hypothetical protein
LESLRFSCGFGLFSLDFEEDEEDSERFFSFNLLLFLFGDGKFVLLVEVLGVSTQTKSHSFQSAFHFFITQYFVNDFLFCN